MGGQIATTKKYCRSKMQGMLRRRKSNQYVRAWKPALIKLKIFIHISSNLFKLSLNAVPSEKLQLNHLKFEIFLFNCIFFVNVGLSAL